jgi:hypothetical protein
MFSILWLVFTGKGKKIMVDLYCALIIAGKRTIETVPARYRDTVKEQLAAVGLDENGNPM